MGTLFGVDTHCLIGEVGVYFRPPLPPFIDLWYPPNMTIESDEASAFYVLELYSERTRVCFEQYETARKQRNLAIAEAYLQPSGTQRKLAELSGLSIDAIREILRKVVRDTV